MKWFIRLGILGLAALLWAVYVWLDLGQYLSVESLKAHQATLQAFYLERPVLLAGLFGVIYVTTTALSLPGATVLTLAAGSIFGFGVGLVLVSIASTIGATLAFLTARFLLRDYVQSKFGEKLASINQGMKREGALYLLTLRLVPAFPFFMINLLMGLTPIRVLTFFVVSQIGMLPGTAVYVNAGTQLAQVNTLRGILSPTLLLSFALVGILPFIAKWAIGIVKTNLRLSQFKKPKHFDYNMVVIGAGSAGLVSAYIAAAVKAKVALIEKHQMGGDCLNTGCVPSKALLRSAKIMNYFKRAKEFGLDSGGAQVDFAKVMERVQKIIKEVEPHDSVERYTDLGVDCIRGQATIRSPYEVEVNGRTLTTKNIVVATGASPFIPPIPGLMNCRFLTSDNVWQIRTLPKRLVILGGGPIGCELAQAFARLGSQVTVIEIAPRIMAREDQDVSDFVTAKFNTENIMVLTAHRATRVEGDQKTVVCELNGKEVRVPFDELLVALGRAANVKGFGLENLKIEISAKGTIVADEYMRTTNFPNIFVCGDVTGPFQFTHVAAHQAWFVAVNALFRPLKMFKVDYRVIPWCTFTDPEVARVGLNELEAREKGIEYQVSRYGIDDLDRAIADGEAHGFVKVLTKPGTDKILGVTIVGSHAGDIIAEYVTAMKYGLGLNKILGTIHIYPTLAEANKYAAGVWKKSTAPKGVLNLLEKFHAWRR
jgi:dihydrolipoamide dehydrogenase